MTRVTVNKLYFHKLLERRYGKYILDGKPSIKRYMIMLSCECDVTIRTIYSFQANTFGLRLLEKILKALDVTEEEFKQLINIEKINKEL